MNNRKNLDDQKLYLMVNEIGRYKIGISNDPMYRRKTLEMGGGVGVDILKVWDVYGVASSIERGLHNKYSENRLMGEWFDFNDIESVINHINNVTNLVSTDRYSKHYRTPTEEETSSLWSSETVEKEPASSLTGKLLVQFKDMQGNLKWHILNNLSEASGEVLICEKLGVVE